MRSILRATIPCALAALASCLNVSPAGPSFASDPPGARVLVDGRDSGWVTPCQIALDEEEEHAITIALDGYAPRELLLVPEERLLLVDWRQGVNGVRSTIRFPILLPLIDLVMPFREVEALAPGHVFVRLRPAEPQ